MSKKITEKGATPVWLAITMVAVVGFLAWLVWSLVSTRGSRVAEEAQQSAPFEKPAPSEIRVVVGTVTEIKGREITLRAPADRNSFSEDREIMVTATEDTQIMISAPAAPESGSLVQRRKAAWSDVVIGDEVSVTAAENVLEDASLVASKIEIAR